MDLKTAIEGFRLYMSIGTYAQQTIDLYQWVLTRLADFLDNVELEALTHIDLNRFMEHNRAIGYAPASLDNFGKGLRAFNRWFARELNIPRIDGNLPRPRYRPPEIIPYTEDEIRAMLDACKLTALADTKTRQRFRSPRHTQYRDTAIVLVLLDTGMRISELARLKINDLNQTTGELHILAYSTGHKTKARTVFVGAATRRALWRWLSTRRDAPKDAPLFCNSLSDPLNRDALFGLIQNLGKRAGVSHAHPHRFRHTCAIYFLRNGGDVFTLQRILGHSSLEMVRHYLSLCDTDVAAAHLRASPVDRLKI